MLKRIAAPDQVMLIDEVKKDLLIDHDEHDRKIENLIARAEAYIDGYTGILGKAMLTQQWTKTFTGFSSKMRLDLPPLQQVDSITYYDQTDAPLTLATSVYAAHDDPRCPYVILKSGQTWPATYVRDDAVTVTFTVGATARHLIPANIKAAISLLVGFWYENTEAATIEKTHPIHIGVEDLLHPNRVLL